jgi:thymidylate kinase
MIIAFTGIDGSGKSLQARTLTKVLSREGFPALYVWSRWSPLLLKPIMRLGRLVFGRQGNSEDERYETLRGGKRRMFRHSAVARAWKNLALLDYSLQVLVKIGLRCRRGRIIVCDRYLTDLLVDLSNNFGYGEEHIPALHRSPLLGLFPKPDLAFLLDLPAEVAFERKDDVPLSYLRDRRALYLSFGAFQGAEIVDGTGTIRDVGEVIHRKTIEFLERGK